MSAGSKGKVKISRYVFYISHWKMLLGRVTGEVKIIIVNLFTHTVKQKNI